MTSLRACDAASLGAGFGLRQPHYREVIEQRPRQRDGAWLEVHSENFFCDGGPALATLLAAREHYPISLHGVGLSLASADGLRQEHVRQLRRLVERVEPVLVSEHLCWAAIGPNHLNDLLPLPYTAEALRLVERHVLQVQEALARPILIENISSYVQFRSSQMSECEFLAELVRRTGCGVLLDVNNLYVNARNHGFAPERQLAALPAEAVKEIHLAGFTATDELLVDTHSACVADDVWALYEHALARLGPRPTLIEWDQDLPPLDVLLGEVDKAAARLAHLREPAPHERRSTACTV
jgi:uncharacterized protein (UPF0276 family)